MLHTKLPENRTAGSGEEDFYFIFFLIFISIFFFLIQFYVPFKLFHSYRDESIGRWGENRSTIVFTFSHVKAYVSKIDIAVKYVKVILWSSFDQTIWAEVPKATYQVS